MGKKVAVLISTYNGEKYLKEQLDSILNQTYPNIEIVIRDDGSSDSTIEIIKEYQQRHDNITFKEGTNIGFIKSFFKLLEIANADYYAYCDQDDIWLENKLELAVQLLEGADDSKPNLASDYYDENMNLIGEGEKHKTFSFQNSLYECVTQGMTMVINQKAKEIIIENLPEKCFFHDWWTYMICSGMGEVLYSDETVVKYRRFQKNATAEGQNIFKIFLWRIEKLITDNGMKDIKAQQIEYKKMFYNKLPDENKKLLDIFVQEKYNFFKAIRKVFYPQKLRRKLIDDIMIRILFLLGVL